jgi:hypothetical protein
MISKVKYFFLALRNRQRVQICLAKGTASMFNRSIDLTNPISWEFSGFSQNGEDGIIDVLRSQLKAKNRYFIEIGAADGIDNNSAWLSVVDKYNGIMVEGNSRLADTAKALMAPYSIGTEVLNIFVTKDNVVKIKERALCLDPDILSLDIDGNDYYIAKELFKLGFRPKIFVVEYNSVYGPDQAITINYQSEFVFSSADKSKLYYGVSINGWKVLFERMGYRFITVDQNGVNAFFVREDAFDVDFLDSIRGLNFAENQYQYNKFKLTSVEQFKLIEHLTFFQIN